MGRVTGRGWIGVDLDATLAHYTTWIDDESIGEPIWPMVERVKQWLAAGRVVKIFTARISYHPLAKLPVEQKISRIQDWCCDHIGKRLEVTNVKTWDMIELWDDRAVQVEPNTGHPVTYWQTRT